MAIGIGPEAAVGSAISSLAASTSALGTTTGSIASGLSVGGVEDDSAIFTIAQGLSADIAGFNATEFSLSNASSVLDVSVFAGETISGLLIEAQGIALAASAPGLDDASLGALSAEFGSILSSIDSVASSAGFGSLNLVDGTTSGLSFVNPDGTSTAVATGADLTSAGLGLSTTGFATAADAATALSEVTSAFDSVGSTLAEFGAASESVDLTAEFLTELEDTTAIGIGNLIDADLAEEAADLAASSVATELGVIALGIANSAPGALLTLFNGPEEG